MEVRNKGDERALGGWQAEARGWEAGLGLAEMCVQLREKLYWIGD